MRKNHVDGRGEEDWSDKTLPIVGGKGSKLVRSLSCFKYGDRTQWSQLKKKYFPKWVNMNCDHVRPSNKTSLQVCANLQ